MINNDATKNGKNGILYLTNAPKLAVERPIEKANEIENARQNKRNGF